MALNEVGGIIERLGRDKVRIDEPMSRHTTFRIGGSADIYFEARTSPEVINALLACRDLNIPYFILGVGANLLVGDKGIRGLTMRPLLNDINIVGSYRGVPGGYSSADGSAGSHYRAHDEAQYLKFDDLEIAEPAPDTLIKVGAGVSLPVLISWTLEQGLTGLQNFAGIPASLGGSVYNNVHGGTKLFSEFVHEIVLLNREGEVLRVPRKEMEFAYDQSRLKKTGEVVLEAILALAHGDAEKARRARLEWLRRKLKIQPQKDCPGCVFKNISPWEAQRIGAPTVATGWIIDIGLGLKGTKIGGVKVSEKHANFFVNTGKARASEVLELISFVKSKVKDKFNLDLVEEIQMVGEF